MLNLDLCTALLTEEKKKYLVFVARHGEVRVVLGDVVLPGVVVTAANFTVSIVDLFAQTLPLAH